MLQQETKRDKNHLLDIYFYCVACKFKSSQYNLDSSQVSNRKVLLFELFHESGVLHFHKYPWGS